LGFSTGVAVKKSLEFSTGVQTIFMMPHKVLNFFDVI